jgi:hypothetical protein
MDNKSGEVVMGKIDEILKELTVGHRGKYHIADEDLTQAKKELLEAILKVVDDDIIEAALTKLFSEEV